MQLLTKRWPLLWVLKHLSRFTLKIVATDLFALTHFLCMAGDKGVPESDMTQ